jgi:Kdo2-lipid IVA lauroyltransferase/acyltransferase
LKQLRRFFVYRSIEAAFHVLRFLPLCVTYPLFSLLGLLAYYIIGRERGRALEHLRLALGDEYTDSQLRHIARGVFIHLGRVAAEALSLESLMRPGGARFDITGLEEAHRLRDLGQPVCMATAHVGNWELLPALVVGWGCEVGIVMRNLMDERLDRTLKAMREAPGVKIYYTKGSDTRAMMRRLRKGDWLGALVDQNIRLKGIEVPFFGHPAHTPTGFIEIALKTEAVILPIFCRRVGYRHFKVDIGSSVDVPEGSDEERIRYCTAAVTSSIENVIRQSPQQWVWMHRRWKNRRNRKSAQRFGVEDGGN